MNSLLDVLIYLDEGIVKNLASLVLTGYIETRTYTQSMDKYLNADVHIGDRAERNDQFSYSKTERSGFKDKNKLDLNNCLTHHHIDKDLGGKQVVHVEEQLKTTYTTFVLNGNLVNYLNENNILLKKNESDIINNDVKSGDIVEIEGTITNSCLVTYVDTLINVIDIFGVDTLNEMINKKDKIFNFSIFLKILKYLKGLLTSNNTCDMLMNTGSCSVVLTINKDNFMNTRLNMFDEVNCKCRVVGKVVKTCAAKEDTIGLLRKTGEEEFYERIFKKYQSLIEIITKLGIVIPKCPTLRISEKSIQVLPFNIYI
ncbi:hypothetical protein [Clostridium sp. BJN0001]|uniref:DUF6414 family protein n=1 Tax=Clostridium sp. BJN0001 TaxID=2930219 RepID=UPI001FD52040|nr:hypothetical protein [Clostridium sp. BJN0001]